MKLNRLPEGRIPPERLEKLKDTELLKKAFTEGKTLKEIIGYSDEVVEKFYLAASQLFHNKVYEKSANAFLFLTVLDPQVYSFWLGLGMSEQLGGDCEKALVAYSMATLLDPSQPLPYYHSATCYQTLQNWQDARASLELAIEFARDQDEYDGIKRKAEQALLILNQ